MKDIMFFLNQHIDGIELEPGNSSSNNQSETPNLGDLPQSELRDQPLEHIMIVDT